ncbi:MAG: alpha-galactosidase, partial [Treponema sp.]|nr:alpha-galactosidase [Treponema sp.]
MITFNKNTGIFKLENNETTYAIKVDNGNLLHVWYGSRLEEEDLTYLTRNREFGFSDTMPEREKLSYMDYIPFELPCDGLGDFRETALSVINENGHNGIEPKYKAHKIYKGTPSLDGLPCVFGDAETLEITAEDKLINVEITLLYTVFENINSIVRSVKIKNNGSGAIKINKCLSLSLDMDNENFDMISLHGSWARERHIDRHPVSMGLHQVKSSRGESSHQEHPFVALLEKKTDWNSGRVWGINFIYSGNFVANVQKNQFDSIRLQIGINPENFQWALSCGEEFISPQAVITYSEKGLNGMSQSFHSLYRNHLIRSSYNHKMRPILINNWEATYFDFNTEKLLDIAREAAKDGIEMLVMDDGWFGKRNFDNCSLGDWVVNEE